MEIITASFYIIFVMNYLRKKDEHDSVKTYDLC